MIEKIIQEDYISLSKDEREKELKNAFILKDNKYDLKNKNILLVDDIFTTGSTVNEISKILKHKWM